MNPTNTSKHPSKITNKSPENAVESYATIKFRLLGLLPLILFLARLRDLLELDELGHILWMCHLSNLVLALGFFLTWPLLVRVSIPWLLFGLPLWIWDMTEAGIGGLTSFGTHIGGLAVGLFALSKMRSGRRSWVYALAWYLIVQQVCRMFTPVELNVNIAHNAYSGWEEMFPIFWQYWLGTTILAGVALWIVNAILFKLFPPKGSL